MTNRIRLTAGRVDAFACPTGKSQAFLWDTEAPALALRATPTGRKTYAFEARLNGDTLRVNIGTVADWPLDKARTEAQRLKMLVDAGTDPRQLKRQQQAEQAAQQAAAAAQAVTVGEAWGAYIEARRPHWGERHHLDHGAMARPGGEPVKRGKGKIQPGPLAVFMPQELRALTPEAVESWAAREAQTRPTRARLALRLLRAFLAWCKADARYTAGRE